MWKGQAFCLSNPPLWFDGSDFVETLDPDTSGSELTTSGLRFPLTLSLSKG